MNKNLEATIKVLLRGKLIHIPKSIVRDDFKLAFKYALSTENYLLAARLRNAKNRYLRQLKNLVTKRKVKS